MTSSDECPQARRMLKGPAARYIGSACAKTEMARFVCAYALLASTPQSFELADGLERSPELGAVSTRPVAAAGLRGFAPPRGRDRGARCNCRTLHAIASSNANSRMHSPIPV